MESLKKIAAERGTQVNHLIESALKELLSQKETIADIKLRPKPKDRVQFKTTYDYGLLTNVKTFSEERKLFINDVIEYSLRTLVD